ncbi:MAG: hypothetical protein OHK0046_42710 [Anaerolineae bacterium]
MFTGSLSCAAVPCGFVLSVMVSHFKIYLIFYLACVASYLCLLPLCASDAQGQSLPTQQGGKVWLFYRASHAPSTGMVAPCR